MTTSTNTNDPRERVWGPCPKGAVQGLVTSLRRKRQRRQVLQAAAAACMLAVVCGTAWLVVANRPYDPQLAGLHCSEVLALADELIAGELDDITRGKLISHCEQCESCYRKIELMRASLEPPPVSRPDRDTKDHTAARQRSVTSGWQLALQ